MRKQIAAANWKMNLTLQQGEALLDAIIGKPRFLKENQQAVFAVPFPYWPWHNKNWQVKQMFLWPHKTVTVKVAPIPVKFRWKCYSRSAFNMLY